MKHIFNGILTGIWDDFSYESAKIVQNYYMILQIYYTSIQERDMCVRVL